jgi:hypothetical protein
MRVEVTPRRLSIVPGRQAVVTVSVTNTASIISGHEIRVLGVDPEWVRIDQPRLSLFPDTSGVAVLTINLPEGIPAGIRELDVEVRELTEPHDAEVIKVALAVPADLHLTLGVDPVSTAGGKSASAGVVVENTGNAVVDIFLAGKDEEGMVTFVFDEVAALAPGEQAVSTARLRAKRPWFGTIKIRPYTVETGPPDAPVVAHGVWVQSPRLTRGKLALVGLLAAATVFAIVIAATLSGLGHKSNQDLALSLQVAQASTETKTGGGTSGLSGTVRQLSTHAAVSGITVSLFKSSDTSDPVASTATGATGGFHFSGLASGSYKVQFNGAGFSELWYPRSLGAADAQAVTLTQGQLDAKVNVFLGGIPAAISGQVVGGDPTGAILTLQAPGVGAGAPAVVTTQTLDATGDFVLADVPSPAVYDLVVTKTGYATVTQQVDLGGGEDRGAVTIELHKGDGSIEGRVSSSKGGINGATISASDSTTTVNTISLSKGGRAGTFILEDLPTPDTLTLLVTAPGYKSQTLSVTLAADQQLTGIAVTLTSGVGTISGIVTTPDNTPKGGVTVVASDGNITETTVTLSSGKGKGKDRQKVGTYSLAGLPVPGTYTVTFSRSDLESQTRAEALTASSSSAPHVNAKLRLSSATLRGIVSQRGNGPVGNVVVTVNSGTTSYTVTTATNRGPSTKKGSYEIQGIVPGTYTLSFSLPGVLPISTVINLAAGDVDVQNPTLQTSASIKGRVVFAGTHTPAAGAEVRLYLTAQYPSVVAQSETIGAGGRFEFIGVQAPDSYVVGVAYPTGSPDQETVEVTTVPEQEVAACQAGATGGNPTTSTTTTTTTTTIPPRATTTTTSTTSTTASTTTTTTTTPDTGVRDRTTAAEVKVGTAATSGCKALEVLAT